MFGRQSVGLVCFFMALSLFVASAQSAPPESQAAYVPTPGAGLVYVSPPVHPAGNDVDAVWQREIRTHAALMGQPALYLQIMQNADSDLRKTALFKAQDGDMAKMLAWLEKSVRVQPVPGTALIEISVAPEGVEKKEAQTIIREIVSTYLMQAAEKVFQEGQRRSQALHGQRSQYRALLLETEARYLALIEKTPEKDEEAAWKYRVEKVKRAVTHLEEKLSVVDDEVAALEAEQTQKLSGGVTWARFPELMPGK